MKLAPTSSATWLVAAWAVLLLPVYAASDDSAGSRYSRSVEGRSDAAAELRTGLAGAVTREHTELISQGPRISPGRTTNANKPTPSSTVAVTKASHEDRDFQIYDADSEVFYDFDHDGYYHGFAVSFDADVSDGVADVFAELYLSRNGGPWNHYFTTRVFSIFGATSEDEYEVITELDAGYPSGDYDVLIELYDAASGDFLTDFGPDDSFALAFLPLEDAERDLPPVYHGGYHGGGSSGPILLVLLLVLLARRQLRHERRALATTDPAPRGPA